MVAENYTSRNYYAIFSPPTATQLTAYLLKTTNGNNINFIVGTNIAQGIYNAQLTASILIGSVYYPVQQVKTDSAGVGTLFLKSGTTYQIKAESPAYYTQISYITPVPGIAYPFLLNPVSTSNMTSLFDDITWRVDPITALLLTNTSQQFNYTISASNGDLTNFGMNITYPNGSTAYASGLITTPSGGTIVTTVAMLGYTGSLQLHGWFNKINYTRYDIYNTYNIYNVTPPVVNNTIAGILASMKDSNTGLDSFSLNILAILITTIAAGFLAQWTYQGAGLGAAVILGMFTYVGWFKIMIAIPGSGVIDASWGVYSLMLMAVMTLLFLRSGT